MRSLVLGFCGLVFVPPLAIAADASCDDASAQSNNLRIDKDKNAFAIQLLDKSAKWRVVFRSTAEVSLPRQSPDTSFVAFVSSERGTPWLYLQRLSTSAREPIAALEATPAQLCFDSAATLIHVVDASGRVTDYDFGPQLRLLPGR